MPRAHFTIGEVEALIPTMEQIFVHVLQLRAGLHALGSKLDRAGVRVTRDDVELDAGPPAVRQARAVFRGLDEALTDQLDRIRALGGQVKDVETGLVDFPSTRGDEEILLCWKLGEKRVGFWHSVEGGYGARRPIDEQVSSAAQRPD
jgi:hypothetical protein